MSQKFEGNLYREPATVGRFKADASFAVGLSREEKHIAQETLDSLARRDLKWEVHEPTGTNLQREGFRLQKRYGTFTITRDPETLSDYSLRGVTHNLDLTIKSFAIVSVLYAAIEAKVAKENR